MLIRRRCGAVRTLRSLRSLRVLMAAAASTALTHRERVVEVREASAAAVAKAFCKPSEFHHDTCLCSPGHILPGGDRALTIGQYV